MQKARQYRENVKSTPARLTGHPLLGLLSADLRNVLEQLIGYSTATTSRAGTSLSFWHRATEKRAAWPLKFPASSSLAALSPTPQDYAHWHCEKSEDAALGHDVSTKSTIALSPRTSFCAIISK